MISRIKVRKDFVAAAKAPYQARGGVVVQARKRVEDGQDRTRCDSDEAIRAGFTATKKIGNAVARNRAKRRLRAAVQQVLPAHAQVGHDYVFIARAGTIERDWAGLLDDVEAALIRLSRAKPAPKPQ